jgi:hypothetical protein
LSGSIVFLGASTHKDLRDIVWRRKRKQDCGAIERVGNSLAVWHVRKYRLGVSLNIVDDGLAVGDHEKLAIGQSEYTAKSQYLNHGQQRHLPREKIDLQTAFEESGGSGSAAVLLGEESEAIYWIVVVKWSQNMGSANNYL